jgi:hypothetical protein
VFSRVAFGLTLNWPVKSREAVIIRRSQLSKKRAKAVLVEDSPKSNPVHKPTVSYSVLRKDQPFGIGYCLLLLIATVP